MKKMRQCEQCYEDFEVGTGVSEDDRSRVRLTERFCTDYCADEYNKSFDEAIEDEEGDETTRG